MLSNTSGFQREQVSVLSARLREPTERIQILSGPRQVGKTTILRQAAESVPLRAHYASADEPQIRDRAWLVAQWEEGRRLAAADQAGAVLMVDEIQKVAGWSETVKYEWDADRTRGVPLRVALSGSAALTVQRGLSESLTGRFEVIRVPHWSFGEMRSAFGYGIDEFIFFGGYPGAAPLRADEERWAAFVRDSIIETTISRDLLLMTRVDKPALLRSLFRLVCDYSAQIVSYQKLTGRLPDAGNTTTLAHYLDLLGAAGLATGLEKYSRGKVRQRRSSPKLLALDTGLVAAASGYTFSEAVTDRPFWGRLVETAVGAHLHARVRTGAEVLYWRDRGREVDYVIQRGPDLTALEVKSGRARDGLPGLDAFRAAASPDPVTVRLVGSDGTSLEDFLTERS